MPAVSDPQSLNAEPNPKHFSYRVLGLLSWGILAACCLALVAAPRLLLEAARIIAIYMTVRLIAYAVFYLGAQMKIRRTGLQAEAQRSMRLSTQETVHHLVILPNFDEPQEVLSRTLASLSGQAGATVNLTVVLAMEASEPGGLAKAKSLQALFEGRFSQLLATVHPSGLPGEIKGKGTNAAWAVRSVRQELLSRREIPLERIVVTVADADAVFHPGYFAELARCFVSDPCRYSRLWQAPILTDMDIWQTHPVIRMLTFFSNAVSAGDFHNPWEAKSPYSTYSLSLKLLEEVEYWDPTLIAEDVNLFMRAFFRKAGQVSIQRIYLPVRSNPVHGASLWHAAAIFYAQKVRHGLGGAELGYLLQKWNHLPETPFLEKARRLLKLIHDHLFFSTAGFVVALGTAVSTLLDHTALITYPPASSSPWLFLCLNLLGGAALLVIWWFERARLSRGREGWNARALLGEAASFALFPLLFFLLFNLPGLHAQTRMLLGRPFTFNRTPKWLDSRVGE